MTARRLPTGGAIDRDRPLHFSFNGRNYAGFAGDTLASALLANDVAVVGRSFKLHRPRGLMAAGVEEPNALIQIGQGARIDTNLRATEVELTNGLEARAVNCWPSAKFDLGAAINMFGRFLPAGFYYKTFMWPRWSLFEPFIRRAAGLGRPSTDADPDCYETTHAHCDVLVVGAGPAGLAAALAAGDDGARVILCEQDSVLGGSLDWDPCDIDEMAGSAWLSHAATALASRPETRVLTRTAAVGYFDHNAVTLLERVQNDATHRLGSATPRLRLWHVRAKRVILATGAIERPLIFPGNDRPGVMLASAVRQYLGRWAVRAGDRAVIFTNNDLAYATAHRLAATGAKIAAVVDVRTQSTPARVHAEAMGLPVMAGAAVVGTRGLGGLVAVRVRDASRRQRWIAADLLAMSGGFNPTVQLFRQSGGQLDWDDASAQFRPGRSVQAECSVGAASGEHGLALALADGHKAGLEAATLAGFTPRQIQPPPPAAALAEGLAILPLWKVDAPGKAFVDFQNDVTTDDIALAAREGYVSVEHLKRYTTLGMAPDQGKTSNVNAVAILAGQTARTIAEAGTTSFRFPFTPVAMGALAGQARGDLYRPIRRLPAHAPHVAAGATFEEYGGWLRPAYYARNGETPHAAEQREARVVREHVGLFDGSPLGKIEVVGPDAAAFLDRIYANTMSTLKVSHGRYGLMLNELGVIFDDGVTFRMDDETFLVGTTSGGATRIASWLDEWLQCEWPNLNVIVAPVTTAWAVLTLSGPAARDVLRAAGTDLDLSHEAFPHMRLQNGHVADVPARVGRVSFTGEMSYEVNVPARHAGAIWDTFLRVGESHGIAPVGVDAWMLLRTERGYLHVGADTDGTTSPDDIGWSHIHKRKSDFVGRRSLLRPENVRADRLQFVGLAPAGETRRGTFLPIGAHVRARGSSGASEGYVTSSGFSPTLGRGVALGMVRNGRARIDETVDVLTPQGTTTATITRPGAYDPAGERLNA